MKDLKDVIEENRDSMTSDIHLENGTNHYIHNMMCEGDAFEAFSLLLEKQFNETVDTIHIWEMLFLCNAANKPIPEWCQEYIIILSVLRTEGIKYNKTDVAQVKTRWRRMAIVHVINGYRLKGMTVYDAVDRVAQQTKLHFSTVEDIYKKNRSDRNKANRDLRKRVYRNHKKLEKIKTNERKTRTIEQGLKEKVSIN